MDRKLVVQKAVRMAATRVASMDQMRAAQRAAQKVAQWDLQTVVTSVARMAAWMDQMSAAQTAVPMAETTAASTE